MVVASSAVASAQARVVVEVRNPGGTVAEGEIVLTSSEGTTFTCRTQNGVCEISEVPGGQYVATLRPSSGEAAPPPRTVMIPPSGPVTLRVSTR